MNNRIKNIGRFGFHFATAVYLLAVPFSIFMMQPQFIDRLMPLESGLATSLSVINSGLAARFAWKAIH